MTYTICTRSFILTTINSHPGLDIISLKIQRILDRLIRVWVPQIETNLFNNPLAEVLKPTFIGRPREELAGFEQLGKVTGSIQEDIGNKDNHKEKVGYENLPLDGGVVVVVVWWWP